MDRSDISLRDLLLDDPEEGWRRLLSEHEVFLKNQIRKYGLPQEDFEDVFQDLCHRLVKDDCKLLRRWDPQKSPFRRYLQVIAVSVCLNFLRSRFNTYTRLKAVGAERRFSRFIETLRDESAPSPRERMERIESVARLRNFLDRSLAADHLPPDSRLLLELRLRGATYQEMAGYLGISIHTARQRFSRLTAELKKRAKLALEA